VWPAPDDQGGAKELTHVDHFQSVRDLSWNKFVHQGLDALTIQEVGSATTSV
jgi:hypothetical protein